MHFFQHRAHSPIWLCVPAFLRLCTVLCICVIMAYCAARFHRNVSLQLVARCMCDATYNIPWQKKAVFFCESSVIEVIAYF